MYAYSINLATNVIIRTIIGVYKSKQYGIIFILYQHLFEEKVKYNTCEFKMWKMWKFQTSSHSSSIYRTQHSTTSSHTVYGENTFGRMWLDF